MSLRWGFRQIFVAFLVLSASACGSSVRFEASAPEARSPSVTVKLLQQDGEIFEFLVLSHADEQLLILRDDVVLVVDGQRHARESGGLARTYDLPPGGSHAVNVKFSPEHFAQAREFDISFATAIRQKGEVIEGPSIHFVRAAGVE